MKEWLHILNAHWTPVMWILVAGAFLLVWYVARRGKHSREIRDATIETHRRRLQSGEISKEEFKRFKKSLTHN